MKKHLATYELIKEIFFLLDDGDRRLLSQFDLTVPRFYALVHLGESPGLSPNKLSELMLCDKSNVLRIVRGLEVDALVSRQRHERDGRSYRLYLTQRGEAVRQKALDAHQAHIEKIFQSYDDEDEAQVQRLMGRLKAELVSDLRL